MQRAAALFLVFLASALAAAVHAQDAEALITHGVELRKHGQNAAALAEFQRAFAQTPSPRAAAQIALAQQALGEWEAAEEGLRAALAMHDDAWIERNRQPLTAALDTVQARLATLWIDCNVPGATLLVDGRTLGTAALGRSVRVRAGTLQIEARAPGRPAVHQEVEIAARAEQHVALSFAGTADNVTAIGAPSAAAPGVVATNTGSATPDASNTSTAAPDAPSSLPPAADRAAATAPANPPAASAPAARESPAFPRARSTPDPAADSGSGLRTAAVVAFITGGVFLATGITANVIHEYDASKWNDPNYCMPPLEERCGAYRKTANDAQKVMIIGYAGAGAILAAGLIMWLAAPSGSESPNFDLSIGPRGGSATFTRAF